MTTLLADDTSDTDAGRTPADDWREHIDEPWTCVAIRQETHDVVSVDLRPQPAASSAYPVHRGEPARLRFLPGQHLTVTMELDGAELSRCYSISSSASRPDTVSLTVKRVTDGPVSQWLHDRLRVGDTLRVNGPHGSFSIDDHPADRYLFLSAGSGITPLMSMTRTLRDRSGFCDVVFVHSARTPADIIFRDELQAIAARGAGIRVAVLCEADSSWESWTGIRGRLTGDVLGSLVPDVLDREIFTCGPAPYMASVSRLLDGLGVDPSHSHMESFVLEPGRSAPPTASPCGDGPQTSIGTDIVYAVDFVRSGRVVPCPPTTTLLEAASQAGLSLPSSCGEGVCGTCKTAKISGTVDMNHAGGIRPREIAQDKILLCCSTPRSDVSLDA